MANKDTWEARMAARAATQRGDKPPRPDAHAGHHGHVRGNSTECSCGQVWGAFSVSFEGYTEADFERLNAMWDAARCSVCGEPAVLLAEDFFKEGR